MNVLWQTCCLHSIGHPKISTCIEVTKISSGTIPSIPYHMEFSTQKNEYVKFHASQVRGITIVILSLLLNRLLVILYQACTTKLRQVNLPALSSHSCLLCPPKARGLGNFLGQLIVTRYRGDLQKSPSCKNGRAFLKESAI